MGELLWSIWAWLTRKEKSSVAIEGFDLLSKSQREFNQQILGELTSQSGRLEGTETRLDECEQDRDDLRRRVGVLARKVRDCDEDREDLRQHLNKHSIEIDRLTAKKLEHLPEPPRRTTQDETDQ